MCFDKCSILRAAPARGELVEGDGGEGGACDDSKGPLGGSARGVESIGKLGRAYLREHLLLVIERERVGAVPGLVKGPELLLLVIERERFFKIGQR